MAEKSHLSDVLDSLPQAVLVVRIGDAITYANAAAENVFQASSSQLIKNGLKQVLPPSSGIYDVIKQVLNSKIPVNAHEVDISGPRTGDGVIVDIYGTPIEGGGEEAVIVLREKSVAHRIARQLSHRTVARSVTSLAEMLAHEIKNPLSGIRGAAQLLEGAVSENDRELAQLIRTETDRVVKILDRMEVFSDETPVEIEPVNMHSVLGQVRKIAQNGFASDIKFVESYDPSLPAVSGSRDELVQVFLNLVKNAAEALSETKFPKITLTSAYRPGIRVPVQGSNKRAELPLEFTITDNGSGVADEIRADIFEPFITTRMNGTGLGLALVAKTVGRHGGIIECSDTGNGTSFRLLLPAWREPVSSVSKEG